MVLALGLMGFILLLLVSMSTLVQVELQGSAVLRKEIAARENARLGLLTALAELQRLAGPDQRVTAPAALLSDAYYSNASAAWTGVWQSRPGGGQANDFLGWLVSKPAGTDVDVTFPATAPGVDATDSARWRANDSDWVALVGAGSVGDPKQAVVAARVPITADGHEMGHYAFWVGEEATKARINISYRDPVDDSLTIVPYPANTRIDPGTLDFLHEDSADLRKLIHLHDLSYIEPVPEEEESFVPSAKRYFHDFTLSARGLLTDTRNGGMRRDLTHLFEFEEAFNRKFGGYQPGATNPYEGIIFDKPEYTTFEEYTAWDRDTFDFGRFGAPNWGILRSYYKLKDKEGVADGAIRSEGLNHGDSTPHLAYRPHQNHRYHVDNELAPVLSWYQIGVGVHFLREPHGDPALGEYRYYPRIRFRFIVALYNPYDIAFIRQTRYHLRIAEQVKIALKIDGQDEVRFRLQEILPVRSEDEAREAEESGGAPVEVATNFDFRHITASFLPGETRYFSIQPPVGEFEIHYKWRAQDGQQTLRSQLVENVAYYVDPTEDEHLATATQRGSTSARSRTGSSGSAYFGLTEAEKTDLQWIGDPADEPGFEVTISYEPVDDDPGSTPESLGRITLARSTNNPLIQSLYLPYQLDEAIIPEAFGDVFVQLTDSVAPTIRDYGIRLRTTDTLAPDADSRDLPHRIFVDANVRAFAASTELENFVDGKGLALISGWEGIGFHSSGSSMLDPEVPTSSDPVYGDRYSGYYGSSRESGMGALATVLFHVPREPLISLGTLQHALMGRYSRHPSYIIGNSYAISRLPLNLFAKGRVFDWSYIINQQLWDGYYFSTIPQGEGLADGAVELDDVLLAQLLDGDANLPNPRLTFHIPDWLQVDAAMLTDETEELTAGLVAALQAVEGPFNVNSVSIPAWTAFLSSNSDLQVPIYDIVDGIPVSTRDEEGVVFYRTPVNYNPGFSTTGDQSNFWNSYRTLDDTEVRDLAQAVVAEVRARGPFSSIADFVNRRRSGPDDQRQRGALQAALDKTINNRLSADLVGSTAGAALAIPDDDNVEGGDDILNSEDRPGTAGTGWITQADVLQVLGPLLTVRSDTFTIRAYGDTVNPLTGEVDATAWCEAVVQRIAEPVSNNSALPALADLIDSPHEMGRQFRIISFRWLNAEEI